MKVHFDNTQYSVGNNGELRELACSPSKIKQFIECTGDYVFGNDFIVTTDPNMADKELLIVPAYDNNLGYDVDFVFDKYSLSRVLFKNGSELYSNELQALNHNPRLRDIIIGFSKSMCEANDERYRRSIIAARRTSIQILEKKIAERQAMRLNTKAQERVLETSKKVLEAIERTSEGYGESNR